MEGIDPSGPRGGGGGEGGGGLGEGGGGGGGGGGTGDLFRPSLQFPDTSAMSRTQRAFYSVSRYGKFRPWARTLSPPLRPSLPPSLPPSLAPVLPPLRSWDGFLRLGSV
jgi:hypothetical protein